MNLSQEELLVKLESFCAYQERCEMDVIAKLRLWNISEEGYEVIISKLRLSGFLNVQRFAESYVSGKFRIKKWGKLKIRQGLYSKGISRDVIEKAIAEMDLEQYRETLFKLAERKIFEVRSKQKLDFKEKMKVMRYLTQRGFEYDLITDVMDELVNK
jgi:regulatory protein